mgnify:CR=1 FL=1|jgi:hypothetical protein
MNKINLKERKKNMKQILQNVVNFEKPKVVLASTTQKNMSRYLWK